MCTNRCTCFVLISTSLTSKYFRDDDKLSPYKIYFHDESYSLQSNIHKLHCHFTSRFEQEAQKYFQLWGVEAQFPIQHHEKAVLNIKRCCSCKMWTKQETPLPNVKESKREREKERSGEKDIERKESQTGIFSSLNDRGGQNDRRECSTLWKYPETTILSPKLYQEIKRKSNWCARTRWASYSKSGTMMPTYKIAKFSTAEVFFVTPMRYS